MSNVKQYQSTLDGTAVTPDTSPAGGAGGAGPGGNPSVNLALVTSTGGLSGSIGKLLCFGESILAPSPLVWFLDPTSFDCEEDCEYDFKVEEVQVYRQPTVDKVIIRYRDLGQVTVTLFFKGNNLGDAVVSKFVTVVLGGDNDRVIKTATADLTCTFEAPQLVITRQAFSGQLAITKVLVELQHGDRNPV